MAKMLPFPDTFPINLRRTAAMIAVVMMVHTPVVPADLGMSQQSAIYREVVSGDLKGAIEQYRSILVDPATSRQMASTALLHMGQCLERLGQTEAARNTYTRLLRDFAAEPESAAAKVSLDRIVRSCEGSPTGPRNLRFEQGSGGKAPPGWIVPALPQVADHWAEVRTSGCHESGKCAVLLIPDNAPGFGYLLQSFNAAPYRGKTVRLRAWMKIEATDSYDRGQMSLSVDRPKGKSGFYDDMNDNPVQSTEWTMREIRTQVHEDATSITLGVILKGRGRVWLDGVSFELVR